MRNPDRIDIITTKLNELWHKVPDWRFGQLISNIYNGDNPDPFFTEDDKWEGMLNEWLERLEKVKCSK